MVQFKKALLESDRIAISRVVMRTTEYLSAIYANEDVLVLNLLRFHQELKKV